MILTTHAITGAAIAASVPGNPALGFSLAFASHFALDAIPHWDYKILSASIDPKFGGKLQFNKTLLFDLVRIGGDAILGLTLSFLLFAKPGLFMPVFMGAALGMFPDFLQFLSLRFKLKPLDYFERFQKWSHAKYRFKEKTFLGIVCQLAIIAFVVACFKFLN